MVYKICSFSGGGIRGIVPATIIQEMLEMSKKYGGSGKITDLCDHVVGTSAGGIVAGGLAVSDNGENAKYNPSEITNILFENADKIFNKANCSEFGLINGLKNVITDPNGGYLQYITPVTSFTYNGIPVGSIALGAVGSALLLGAPIALAYYGGATAIKITLGVTLAIGGYAGQYIDTLYQDRENICGVRDYLQPKYGREGIDSVLYQYFGNKNNQTEKVCGILIFSWEI